MTASSGKAKMSGSGLSEQERAGLREQVAQDQAAIDKEWAKAEPQWSVIRRLRDHIEYCERELEK